MQREVPIKVFDLIYYSIAIKEKRSFAAVSDLPTFPIATLNFDKKPCDKLTFFITSSSCCIPYRNAASFTQHQFQFHRRTVTQKQIEKDMYHRLLHLLVLYLLPVDHVGLDDGTLMK